jgi:hypothetical protein
MSGKMDTRAGDYKDRVTRQLQVTLPEAVWLPQAILWAQALDLGGHRVGLKTMLEFAVSGLLCSHFGIPLMLLYLSD